MKWLSAIASFGLMAVLTVSSSGCKKGGDTGGGSTWGSLEQPSEVDMKEGGKATLKVNIKRNKDNKDEITVKVDPPKNIKVDPTERKLKGTETEATFELTAEKGAASGDATVHATPGDLKRTVRIKVSTEKPAGK